MVSSEKLEAFTQLPRIAKRRSRIFLSMTIEMRRVPPISAQNSVLAKEIIFDFKKIFGRKSCVQRHYAAVLKLRPASGSIETYKRWHIDIIAVYENVKPH